MKIFTCRICGEVYIGENIPHTCPFCGVKNKYLVLASVWKNEYNIELTEADKTNLAKALEVELSNASFYKCASENISNQEIALMFKGLYKVECEHASVFRKLLKPKTDPIINESCTDDIQKTIADSYTRENRAIKFYAKALSETNNPKLKEVYQAIMEAEQDHLALDTEMKNKF